MLQFSLAGKAFLEQNKNTAGPPAHCGEDASLRRLIPRAVLAAALTLAGSHAQSAWLGSCITAHLIARWKHDGLWRTEQVYGPKTPDGHQLRFVGKVRAGGRAYKIYYDLNANPDTATNHGHIDLVVATASGRFLGLYDISDIDAKPTRTEGADILFPPRKDDLGHSYNNTIHFGPQGPPRTLHLLFGYNLGFDTPAEFLEFFPHTRPWPQPGPRIADYCKR